jgi:hypothetical protein
MKSFLLIALISLLLISTGCSRRPIPVATSFPITAQLKMQGAHHWDVLATDIAKRLKKTLEITFPNAVVKPSLFVRFSDVQDKTPFGRAFYHLLTTKLVQQGLVVLSTANSGPDNLAVEYDMQVLHHKDRRLTYPPPGLFTALAGGVWLASQAFDSWAHSELVAVPFGVAMDIKSAADYLLPGETNTEVIINTKVKMGQQYIFGDSSIYYVNDGDYDHYENESKTYQLVDQR